MAIAASHSEQISFGKLTHETTGNDHLGTTATGTRVHGFFKPKGKIYSASYISMLKKKAINLLKQENLTLCHNSAIPHILKRHLPFLQMMESRQCSVLTSGRSPDAMPIENVLAITKKR